MPISNSWKRKHASKCHLGVSLKIYLFDVRSVPPEVHHQRETASGDAAYRWVEVAQQRADDRRGGRAGPTGKRFTSTPRS